MRTIEYLWGAGAYWPSVVTALLIGVGGGVLSVIVVLKRMAFIGQGVSHAAFGGVGVAAVLGLTGGTAAADLGLLGVVAAFCVASALGIAWLSSRSRIETDTAIGIVLAVAMAVGFLLHRHASGAAAPGQRPPALESVLFGSILTVGWADAAVAGVVVGVVLGTLWWGRRAVLFWAFDEPAAEAFGVRGGVVRTAVLVLLALMVVVTMRLAGVVLATALLVLPGAVALRLSDRLVRVLVLAALAGGVGVLGGLVLSFERDWQAGPSIVLVLAGLYVPAWGLGRRVGR